MLGSTVFVFNNSSLSLLVFKCFATYLKIMMTLAVRNTKSGALNGFMRFFRRENNDTMESRDCWQISI